MTSTVKLNAGNFKVSVFPNPTLHTFTIDLDGEATAHLFLYNLAGDLVLDKEDYNGQRIDLTHLPVGLYKSFIRQQDKIFNSSLLKQ